MERQDFLMRQIEQMAQLLGKLLADLAKLKAQANQHAGLEAVQEVFKTELNLDLPELLRATPDDFLKTITEVKGFDTKNIAQLADILLDIADDLPEENHPLYQKCLVLYEYLDRLEGTYSFERQGKMERIKDLIFAND